MTLETEKSSNMKTHLIKEYWKNIKKSFENIKFHLKNIPKSPKVSFSSLNNKLKDILHGFCHYRYAQKTNKYLTLFATYFAGFLSKKYLCISNTARRDSNEEQKAKERSRNDNKITYKLKKKIYRVVIAMKKIPFRLFLRP